MGVDNQVKTVETILKTIPHRDDMEKAFNEKWTVLKMVISDIIIFIYIQSHMKIANIKTDG